MTCSEWEIQVEKRGHGALAPEDAAALDAHLSTCASCRNYSGVVQGTERTMHAAEAGLEARIDWERVRAGVERGARRARRELWAGAVWALVCIGVVPWGKLVASHVASAVLLIALAPAVLLGAIAFRYARGRALSAGAARASDGAALGWMREELDARIRERRSVLFLEVAFCAIVAEVGLLKQMPDEAPFTLAFSVVIAVAVGDAAWRAFRALPRLLRERAELGE